MNLNLLERIGAMTIACVLGLMIFVLFVLIKHFIGDLIRKHKIKTRFNKPPTAACYCRDCEQFNPETGKCWDICNTRLISPEWFCCFAVPLTGEQYVKRDKIMKEKGF